ncbi:hypothetical protein [Brevundimonas sp. Root1423]|uniref:hypothetical protein n=1 Tax=Brevundimonas sp. Root1423 TaxID=1736462 RepID=UPI0012E370F8|nr:hypothetical protein [Brevundimonas sp. Root1423]
MGKDGNAEAALAEATIYSAANAAADFPGGPGPDGVVAVSQWGEGYGWGDEATAPLR